MFGVLIPEKYLDANYSLKTASLQEAQPGAGAMEVDNSVAEAAAIVVADRLYISSRLCIFFPIALNAWFPANFFFEKLIACAAISTAVRFAGF